MIKLHPAISAGAIFPQANMMEKFQGTTTTATSRGVYRVTTTVSSVSFDIQTDLGLLFLADERHCRLPVLQRLEAFVSLL